MSVPCPPVAARQYELDASICTSVSACLRERRREAIPYSDLAINIVTERVALRDGQKDGRRAWHWPRR